MCDECDDAQSAPVHVRKMNRHGWRPPLAAAAPRCDEVPQHRIIPSVPSETDRVPSCA